MAIDWDAFNKELTDSDMKTLAKMGQTGGEEKQDYVEVPDGKYEVSLAKLELGVSKAGNPTAYIWFKVLAGDYEGDMIFHTMGVGGKSAAWKIKMFTDFVCTLKSGVDFSYENFKDENGKFDGEKFEAYVDEAYENITNDGIEYAIEKSVNDKGYTTIEVIDVFN